MRKNESERRPSRLRMLSMAGLILAVLLMASCRQIIFIPIPGEKEDPNTSTVVSPYIATGAENLQELISMDTDKPLYIDVPDTANIGFAAGNELTIPSGTEVHMTVNGQIGLQSDGGSRISGRAVNAVNPADYDLVQFDDGSWVPENEEPLITVRSGAKLYLSGIGRIGNPIDDNPSTTLIHVEEGGELTIDGDITFVSFPHKDESPIKQATIYSDGKLTITGGDFFGTYHTIQTGIGSELIITGGTFASIACTSLYTSHAYTIVSNSTSTITGGTIYGLQGAFSQAAGSGEIYNVYAEASTDIFNNINTVNPEVKAELATYYDLNAKDETTSENPCTNIYHAFYIAGEDGLVDKVAVNGGTFKSEMGYALNVGNSADGGEGWKAVAEVKGGSFESVYNKAVNCSEGKDGYGEGYLQISGGRFKGNNSIIANVGIDTDNLAPGYVVSDAADGEGYFEIIKTTTP